MSVMKYRAEDLARARHVCELPANESVCVNLDHKIMGVGGDDSWTPCVHREYLVPPASYQFAFRLRPYLETEHNPTDMRISNFY